MVCASEIPDRRARLGLHLDRRCGVIVGATGCRMSDQQPFYRLCLGYR